MLVDDVLSKYVCVIYLKDKVQRLLTSFKNAKMSVCKPKKKKKKLVKGGIKFYSRLIELGLEGNTIEIFPLNE